MRRRLLSSWSSWAPLATCRAGRGSSCDLLLWNRLGEDICASCWARREQFCAGVLVLACARERNREDLAVGSLSVQIDARVFHRQLDPRLQSTHSTVASAYAIARLVTRL